jgi:Flp pilus assembly protein TadD, contains TPR repeats
MFQHMFTAMHELLDHIADHYPNASGQQRQSYDRQLMELKQLSDGFIEQWIDFEEKLSAFHDAHAKPESEPGAGAGEAEEQGGTETATVHMPCSYGDMHIPDEVEPLFNKGQGYYKLFMFEPSADCFHHAVTLAPECNLARLYLGMSLMHLRDWNEAQRQFQLLVVLSDFPKWVALGYNALGCIQAVRMNLAQAEKLFQKAYEVYPGFTDSLSNLKSCRETPEHLSLYFGSTELCCL